MLSLVRFTSRVYNPGLKERFLGTSIVYFPSLCLKISTSRPANLPLLSYKEASTVSFEEIHLFFLFSFAVCISCSFHLLFFTSSSFVMNSKSTEGDSYSLKSFFLDSSLGMIFSFLLPSRNPGSSAVKVILYGCPSVRFCTSFHSPKQASSSKFHSLHL